MADYNVNMKQWNGTSFDNVLPLAYNSNKLGGKSNEEIKAEMKQYVDKGDKFVLIVPEKKVVVGAGSGQVPIFSGLSNFSDYSEIKVYFRSDKVQYDTVQTFFVYNGNNSGYFSLKGLIGQATTQSQGNYMSTTDGSGYFSLFRSSVNGVFVPDSSRLYLGSWGMQYNFPFQNAGIIFDSIDKISVPQLSNSVMNITCSMYGVKK